MAERNTARIRELNDQFRTRCDASLGRWVATNGVAGQGLDFVALAIAEVMVFNVFTDDNDPYQEHDFGRFEIDDQVLYWKIDYYDPGYAYGSDNPADVAITKRLLTILLASEY